jgi:hypothetical protein
MRIELDLVDEFQQHFGQQTAFEKARDFMFAYISHMRSVLPPAAAKGLEVAKRTLAGVTTPQERTQTLRDMWDYIVQCEASGKLPVPESSITRAITWLLQDELGPGEEYISEVLHWFLYLANEFEDRSDIAAQLLRKVFASEQEDENLHQSTAQG